MDTSHRRRKNGDCIGAQADVETETDELSTPECDAVEPVGSFEGFGAFKRSCLR
jgi:hypothetical protein